MTTTTQKARGCAWLTEDTDAAALFTPERMSEELRLIGRTADDFIDSEVLPVLDRLENKDWDARPHAGPPLRRAGAARHRRARGLRRRGPRQGGVARRRPVGRAVCLVRHDLRRPDRTRHHAAALFRHRGAAAQVPAGPGLGRVRGRLRPQRVRLGLRCAERPRAGRPPCRRQLRAERREDVDHQRRLRRRVHRLCQADGRGRRRRHRPVHRVHRRAGVSRRQLRPGRAQDGHPWLVDDAAHPAGRARAGRERAGRDRQGAQGRLQRPELRAFQAGRDVQRRRPPRHRRGGCATPPSAGSSGSRSRRSGLSATSWRRW